MLLLIKKDFYIFIFKVEIFILFLYSFTAADSLIRYTFKFEGGNFFFMNQKLNLVIICGCLIVFETESKMR